VSGDVPPARQGEVWFAALDPVEGREQAGRRPVLIVSVDQLGTGPSGLAIVTLLTSRNHGQRLHVSIEPPEGGVRSASWIMPERVRALSRQRLVERWGDIRLTTLEQVTHRVHLLTRAPS
jgi:mRNA interferase MazF